MQQAAEQADRGKTLVGIDGGGTHSRGLCTDLTGRVLAYVEGRGTSPAHNSAAHGNFRHMAADLLAAAGRGVSDVACLTAGLAGLDGPEDDGWAQAMAALDGLPRAPLCVNDAVVAHAGALRMQPGIAAVLGTGSITVAIAANGKLERDYDFGHYARATARHLAYDALIRIVSEKQIREDSEFIRQALSYWSVESPDALPGILRQHAGLRDEAAKRRFGEMAPLVTSAASVGSPLARRACDAAAAAVAASIGLVRTGFEDGDLPVSVALIGSVARSEYMRRAIERELQTRSRSACRVIDPALPPVCGAVLLAGREVAGVSIAEVVSNLRKWAGSTPNNRRL